MLSSQRLWNNVYRVVFPELGFELNNIDVEGLKISFTVEKDLTQNTNKTKLMMWNLKKDTRAKIEKPDVKIELYAGYRDNGGALKIFSGTVVMGRSKDEGSDMVTELFLADGRVELRDCVLSLSYPPGTSAGDIIQHIANEMGLPLVYGKGVTPTAYQDGYSFAGKAFDALNEICLYQGFTWSIQNGILQVILAGSILSNRGIVFSTSSGLLGMPSRIIRANPYEDLDSEERKNRQKTKTEKPEKRAGWEVNTLLFPTVNPGDAVKIESRTISGWFRVQTARHEGVSYGGDWQSHFQLIEGLDADGGENEQSGEGEEIEGNEEE